MESEYGVQQLRNLMPESKSGVGIQTSQKGFGLSSCQGSSAAAEPIMEYGIWSMEYEVWNPIYTYIHVCTHVYIYIYVHLPYSILSHPDARACRLRILPVSKSPRTLLLGSRHVLAFYFAAVSCVHSAPGLAHLLPCFPVLSSSLIWPQRLTKGC